ncbi:MAG: peptide deformylase [Rickettsiales bacterium]
MAIITALLMGTPSLREVSLPIQPTDFGSPWLLELVQNLSDTQAHYGGVGIAAPQIGVNKRVILFGFEHTERYKDIEPVPITLLCNPEIKIIDPEEITMYEGCLSLANLRGPVSRPKAIAYSGFDQFGNKISRQVSDFHARLVQHEIDHLDGVLLIDRVKDTRTLGFREELIAAGLS